MNNQYISSATYNCGERHNLTRDWDNRKKCLCISYKPSSANEKNKSWRGL